MRINSITGKNIENLKNIKEARIKEENLKVRKTKSEEKTINQTEVIELSSQKLVERAIKKALSMPEIREEKVAQIKAQIESGTYNVSNKEIA
ncbi:MAG: flagellar biosynthesis anti-sigma factor FlgM, partial [Candidatus Desulfofervidus auxilii]|nr:flagellar biosynthesis anti-sigma factor FlgM [Candidatus Desulfofervidus auxilii]